MTDQREIRVLVVAEYIDEFARLVEHYGLDLLRDPTTCLLALEPELQVHLKARGVPYVNSNEFFGADSHRELASLSTDLLAVIRDGLRIRDDLGVSAGYERALTFYGRFFLHHLLFLAYLVHRACECLKPERVIVPDAGTRLVQGPDLGRDEHYLARVARAVCLKQGIPCEAVPVRGPRLVLMHGLKTAVKTAAVRVLYGVVDLLFERRSRGRVLVVAPSRAYNLRRVLEELRPLLGPGYLPVYLQNNDRRVLARQCIEDVREWSYPGVQVSPRGKVSRRFAAVLDTQLEQLAARARASSHFRYRGVDLSELFNERLRLVYRGYLLKLHAQTVEMNRWLDRHRPALVLAQFAVGVAANLGTLAARKGIPGMLIPHGSMVPATDHYSIAEWREHGLGMTHSDYTHVAMQTPWTRAYLEQSPGTSTPVATGPLLFARPPRRERGVEAEQSRPAEKIVIHVGTAKARDSMRFWAYETVDEYVRNINALICAVEKVGGCRLLVRFRPLDSLSVGELQAMLVPSSCYEICSSGMLEDYLGRADLVVSYSSTAIEEALQLGIPVLQYDPQGKYFHLTGSMLDPSVEPRLGSCYSVAREDHLAWALRWLMANHLSASQPDSLWDEHRFERAAGMRPFLETIGLAAPGERPRASEPPHEMEHAAWIRP